ncbi:hypothetical protein FVEN_g5753 [Fusarium venenatum]|uniref:Uncharacterized protein n=1 Tax=Fusarium venenatum TaxID=56646 RepID=A0A2L2TH68_9HYPO|nr:uncharacterized protein FVRRES_03865 [Fusarium venenatum]KAG8356449.1 hypothetical protein FVEN_g5753 [Fusarium venenatum]CEI67353.1 unnamed protein product [Fusarium venenatum]
MTSHELGMIISAPYHSQKRDNTVSTYDHKTGVSAFGAVYSKYRKMVIIECQADHVIYLLIYSYNGFVTRNMSEPIIESTAPGGYTCELCRLFFYIGTIPNDWE